MSVETPAMAASATPARPSFLVRNIVPILLFAALAVLPFLGLGSYITQLVTRMMILGLAAIALDLVLGYGGLVSFGHAAFLGIGAYAAGILVTENRGDVVYILPAALGVAALFGAFTGYVSLRTRGVAFIMITLAFGQMAFFLAQSLSRYGGDDGVTLYSRMSVFGADVLSNRTVFYFVVLGVLIALYALCRAIVASRFGRVLSAGRENPVRLASLGYDVQRVRLLAYIISGMITAVAGVLLANHTEFVSPAYMSWQRSGELIFIVILGGIGRLDGAIIGALVFLLLEEYLAELTEHWKIIFGALLVAVVLFTRGGILGQIDKLLGRARHG